MDHRMDDQRDMANDRALERQREQQAVRRKQNCIEPPTK
jgi:hypothetical protein